ncbi:MAG TPA: glycosyltransferase 87 family protein [Candidatus Baltobacteraceae bacterium]
MIAELREIDPKVGVWLAVLCGLTLGAFAYAIMDPTALIGYDFQAFWCGANALLAHANPYLNEPLHACEVAHTSALFLRYPNVTVPAPIPPYALALFVPLGLLPFALARAIWWLALAGATIAAGRGIHKVTGIAPITALAASALAIAGPAIVQGALSPLPIALTIFAALALMRARWTLATVLLGLGMAEPHMVLPACIAVFLFVPQMRLRLLLVGVGAAALALAAVGPHAALGYLTTVLPAHAISEVNNQGQSSLTVVLYQLGVAAKTALHIASAQYVVLGVFGIWVAGRLSKQRGEVAWLVLVPAGFAVIGGPFIHLDEVAMAVPLACMIFARRATVPAALVVLLLAIPSEAVINWVVLAAPATLICAWFMARSKAHPPLLLSARLPVIMAVSIAIIGGEIAIGLHRVASAGGTTAVALAGRHIVAAAPGALASVTWTAFNSLTTTLPSTWWLGKILTLVPAAVLVGLTFLEAFPHGSRVAPRLAAARKGA